MKEKCLILNVAKRQFKDKDNNEVSFSITTIGKFCEPTDEFVGYKVEEITGKIENFDVIKNYQNKIVELEFDFKAVGNAYKKKLVKISDQEL